MKNKLVSVFLILAAVGFILTGCGAANKVETKDSATKSGDKSTYPATDDGAINLIKEFAEPGADYAALSKQLRPTKDDYEAVFDSEFATKAASYYDSFWDSGKLIITPGNPARTGIILFSINSDEIINWTQTADWNFPGNWKKVAPHLKPGVKIYTFEFVEPGKTSGMSYEGLVNINGNWRIFPKPSRVIG